MKMEMRHSEEHQLLTGDKVREVEVGGTCDTLEKDKFIRILTRKNGGKISSRRLSYK